MRYPRRTRIGSDTKKAHYIYNPLFHPFVKPSKHWHVSLNPLSLNNHKIRFINIIVFYFKNMYYLLIRKFSKSRSKKLLSDANVIKSYLQVNQKHLS